MHKKKFIVSSFYKFVYLDNPESTKSELKKILREFDVRGTFLIGKEGINSSFSISNDQYKIATRKIEQLLSTEIIFKPQEHIEHSFLRLKIKIKKEIVTLGEGNINPKSLSGKHLNPRAWDKLIKNKNAIIIDTRNTYESDIGSFKYSTKTCTTNFRDFPKWVKKNKNLLRNKEIGMFCTGGIRCEKASSYMINLGYKNVYQLDGGIINYLKETKNDHEMWQGECFVFDERITLNKKLEQGSYSQCFACRSAITEKERKSKFFKSGVSCPKCYKEKSEKQRKRYEERQKQVLIAKKKGIKHLG